MSIFSSTLLQWWCSSMYMNLNMTWQAWPANYYYCSFIFYWGKKYNKLLLYILHLHLTLYICVCVCVEWRVVVMHPLSSHIYLHHWNSSKLSDRHNNGSQRSRAPSSFNLDLSQACPDPLPFYYVLLPSLPPSSGTDFSAAIESPSCSRESYFITNLPCLK